MKNHRLLKIAISVGAVVLLVLRLVRPEVKVDYVTLGLMLLAVLPWFAAIVESADFPGGWKVKFRELETKQQAQELELATLKFLASNLISNHELGHLKKLLNSEAFVHRKDGTSWFFEREIRRLRELNFIAEQPGKGIDTLFHEAATSTNGASVQDHFRITERGQEYLAMRAQLLEVQKT